MCYTKIDKHGCGHHRTYEYDCGAQECAISAKDIFDMTETRCHTCQLRKAVRDDMDDIRKRRLARRARKAGRIVLEDGSDSGYDGDMESV